MKQLTTSDFKEWGIVVDTSIYIPYFNEYIKQFNINTKDRFCSFFANLAHESGNFRYTQETLTGKLQKYLDRVGNYFGRGLLQITFLSNYKLFTEWCKLNLSDFKEDFVKNPELLKTPKYAVLSAFWFWKINNLEKYADSSQFINVCSIINTGRIQDKKPQTINGLEDRINKFKIISNWCDKNKII